jgi:hypothetical protein
MAVLAQQVTVGTSATQLSPAPTDAFSGSSIAVNNTGSVTVYLGGPTVTTATGYPLVAGAVISVDLVRVGGTTPAMDESLFGVAASSTTVSVLVTGV